MKPLRTPAAVAALAFAACALPAFAQQYPAKPVRIITPFPAGSGPDAVLRIL